MIYLKRKTPVKVSTEEKIQSLVNVINEQDEKIKKMEDVVKDMIFDEEGDD